MGKQESMVASLEREIGIGDEDGERSEGNKEVEVLLSSGSMCTSRSSCINGGRQVWSSIIASIIIIATYLVNRRSNLPLYICVIIYINFYLAFSMQLFSRSCTQVFYFYFLSIYYQLKNNLVSLLDMINPT